MHSAIIHMFTYILHVYVYELVSGGDLKFIC